MPLKKVFLIIVLIIAVIFIFNAVNNFNQIYGNDRESIEKVIKSIEGYDNGTIEILGIKDISNDRIVAFLYNNSPAYIQFSKDQKGNYKWTYIEKRAGVSFVPFLANVVENGSTILIFVLVANDENEISKIEIKANEHLFSQRLTIHQGSVSWVELPKSSSYEYKYKYFDKDGKELQL